MYSTKRGVDYFLSDHTIQSFINECYKKIHSINCRYIGWSYGVGGGGYFCTCIIHGQLCHRCNTCVVFEVYYMCRTVVFQHLSVTHM